MQFGTYDTPKPETKPTFNQYIKTIGKGVEGKTKFQVDIVWLPGKFDNVTLQTHAFRYICDPSHVLYTELPPYLEQLLYEGRAPRLDIVISSIEARRISLFDDPKKMGQWEKLGSNALKFKNP